MSLKTITPMREDAAMWEAIAVAIRKHIAETIFKPLLRSLVDRDDSEHIANSLDDLVYAIARGRIQYVDGHFEGRFNASISKELKKLGATWNRKKSWWVLADAKLPVDVRMAIGTSASRFKAMAASANQLLAELHPDLIAKGLDLNVLFESALFKMDAQFLGNVSKVGVVPKLTPDVKRQIAKDYSENTKLDIKKFATKEIERLRAQVQKHTLQDGLRRESMVKSIKAQYGVTDRKAKFLARQETSLLMSAFQKGRYLDAGLPRYKWKCVSNGPHGPHPVRQDHWDLNGSIQDWHTPPVIDRKTGKRGHPKQDYNCRCTAIPIIETGKP